VCFFFADAWSYSFFSDGTCPLCRDIPVHMVVCGHIITNRLPSLCGLGPLECPYGAVSRFFVPYFFRVPYDWPTSFGAIYFPDASVIYMPFFSQFPCSFICERPGSAPDSLLRSVISQNHIPTSPGFSFFLGVPLFSCISAAVA